jgi:RimJ/RimL family protein N-acetyltransferase
MSAFAAAKFPVGTLYGRVLYGNDASCKVMRKSGFQFLGTEAGAKDDPYGKGMLIYAKTGKEYPP